MKRRSVRHWIAGILKLQPHIDEEERHSLIETGIRLGVALVTKKPAHESYKGYGKMVAEQMSGAHVQFLAPPPSAVYEQPEKQTGPIKKPVRSLRQIAADHGFQSSWTRPVAVPPELQRKLPKSDK